MIEKLIKNELTRRRRRVFKRHKRAVGACWLLLGLIVLSLTAELWANNNPLLLYYRGQWYVPVLRYYHPTAFDRTDILQMNYRDLTFGHGDWIVWPLIRWGPFERNDAVDEWPSPPTSVNWLGTDESGRDVLSRLLYGFRYSFAFAFAVWLFSSVIGIAIGTSMGYFGSLVDLIGQGQWKSLNPCHIFYS